MSASERHGFFEAFYASAEGDDTAIPWQDAVSRRLVASWLADFEPGDHRRALVVAAGLGDDAAALAGLGLEVSAFDYAPTAVEWARRRHPDADVNWQVADLFSPPGDWKGAFDLVLEVFTVQTIEPDAQRSAVHAVRDFVGPGGTLVAVALVHDGDSEPQGPPWPLHPSTFDAMCDGFVEASRHIEHIDDGLACMMAVLERRELQ
jgi:hypothetical protein